MKGKKVLFVIDMQVDFVTGALANEDAQKITGRIAEKIKAYEEAGDYVFFTRDTHGENYMDTQEGRMLPVPHCMEGSDGWQIVDQLKAFANKDNTLDKPSFGSLELPKWVYKKTDGDFDEMEFCGVCTDICVISNAMLIKAALPDCPVAVDPSACAGVAPESHETALRAMAACQIDILS